MYSPPMAMMCVPSSSPVPGIEPEPGIRMARPPACCGMLPASGDAPDVVDMQTAGQVTQNVIVNEIDGLIDDIADNPVDRIPESGLNRMGRLWENQ